jgi:hypothetical protein
MHCCHVRLAYAFGQGSDPKTKIQRDGNRKSEQEQCNAETVSIHRDLACRVATKIVSSFAIRSRGELIRAFQVAVSHATLAVPHVIEKLATTATLILSWRP